MLNHTWIFDYIVGKTELITPCSQIEHCLAYPNLGTVKLLFTKITILAA